ncbi:hypothetical protein SK128_003065 [Halocaridina rubra]|uniref:Uncharacterized protein n=1 Tax=Halocaridina rubra TaxID=373956 RepID=A0AAN8WIB8_HALRR
MTMENVFKDSTDNFSTDPGQELVEKEKEESVSGNSSATMGEYDQNRTTAPTTSLPKNHEGDREDQISAMIITKRFADRKNTLRNRCQNATSVSRNAKIISPKLSYYVEKYKLFACIPAKHMQALLLSFLYQPVTALRGAEVYISTVKLEC